MKRIIAIGFMAVAMIAATSSAFAQYASTADIPFNFRVGSTLMPAGTYTIRFDQSSAIWLYNPDRHVSAVTLATNASGSNAAPETLVFNRYGDQYFLSETYGRNRSNHRTFGESKLERNVRAEEASLKSETPVLVATK